jgi:hypothetical protein
MPTEGPAVVATLGMALTVLRAVPKELKQGLKVFEAVWKRRNEALVSAERWCDYFTMAAAARLLHAKSYHLGDGRRDSGTSEQRRTKPGTWRFTKVSVKRGIAVIAVPSDAERSSGLR